MKRITLLAATLILCINCAMAWGGLGHRTIVEIAKRHLTDKAKENISKYMPYDIVKEASWMDRNRLGSPYPYSNDWHSFYYDGKTLRHDINGKIAHGDLVRALHLVDHNLKMYRELSDSAVMYNLRAILHFVGDLHCPVHAIPHGGRSAKVKLTIKGERVGSFHGLYDKMPQRIHGDDANHITIADRIDTAKKGERKKLCKGTIDDWINETIHRIHIVHIWNPNDGTRELRDDTVELSTPLVNEQMQRAGYRLAHLLNSYFGK